MPAKRQQKSTKASRTKNVTKAIAKKADGEQRAYWSTADEKALIKFLIEHRSEAGDGFNFKTPTFNAASLVLDAMRTQGATKTGKVCKNKWAQVRYTVIVMYESAVAFLTTFLAQSRLSNRLGTQRPVRVQVGRESWCRYRRELRVGVGCICSGMY
jgi:hypothetical protein